MTTIASLLEHFCSKSDGPSLVFLVNLSRSEGSSAWAERTITIDPDEKRLAAVLKAYISVTEQLDRYHCLSRHQMVCFLSDNTIHRRPVASGILHLIQVHAPYDWTPLPSLDEFIDNGFVTSETLDRKHSQWWTIGVSVGAVFLGAFVTNMFNSDIRHVALSKPPYDTIYVRSLPAAPITRQVPLQNPPDTNRHSVRRP